MSNGVAVNGDRTHRAHVRTPITDVQAWLDGLESPAYALPALHALGELLLGVTDREPKSDESVEDFIERVLGVRRNSLLFEHRRLNPVSGLTFALALAEWIEQHPQCEVGPGKYSDVPSWTQTEIGRQRYLHPQIISVHFLAGTLIAEADCVVQLIVDSNHQFGCVHTTRDNQASGRVVMDRLAARANELNPYRGRATRATVGDGRALQLEVVELPAVTRDDVVVDESVWNEIDLGLKSVREQRASVHGLGVRRGVLLCGPPGTGKSAVSEVVAREVVGEFTVIYVDAEAGATSLSDIVGEARRLGGPVLLILEDVDLWCGSRYNSAGGLSELLKAMDFHQDARILTLASTNDVGTLDKAAIRTGRFDSIVEVGYPDRADAAKILTVLMRGLPGGDGVDTGQVVAKLPQMTTGSDLREIVRRAVLAGDEMTTAGLLAEVSSGRYRADAPGGTYL